ncbi:protein of unknown function [Hyphomicrobium sp. MC1]|nr:protein of unknown function [Hyphomicrobium sp. MC1]
MALSGRKTPEAVRLYVKRTETQRIAPARGRRAWIGSNRNREQSADKSRNGTLTTESE